MTWLHQTVLDGGIMMVFLIPCSVIVLAYVCQGLIALRRERIAPATLRRLADAAREPEEITAARHRLDIDTSPLARIVTQLGRLSPRNDDELEREAGRLAGEETMLLYHRRVSPLALLRNVSVYLGLLGTILGIMRSFGEYARGAAENSVESLGQGINQALVTTAWGLSIAIPAMIFVHIFRQRLITLERAELPEAALNIHRHLNRSSSEGL